MRDRYELDGSWEEEGEPYKPMLSEHAYEVADRVVPWIVALLALAFVLLLVWPRP